MKEAVLFYSLSGVTKTVAQIIAAERNCDIFEIELVEPYTKTTAFSKGVVDTKKGISPPTKPLPPIGQYDRVWLGTPIWAFGYAAPLNIVFEQKLLSDKEVLLFSTSAGLAGAGSLNGVADKLIGCKVIGKRNFTIAQTKKQSAVSDWVKSLNI